MESESAQVSSALPAWPSLAASCAAAAAVAAAAAWALRAAPIADEPQAAVVDCCADARYAKLFGYSECASTRQKKTTKDYRPGKNVALSILHRNSRSHKEVVSASNEFVNNDPAGFYSLGPQYRKQQ